MPGRSVSLTSAQARALWIRAQRLDDYAPFGKGVSATRKAIQHLGYVQIDTINVIERSHHHILQTRIPEYIRADLDQAQSAEKSVFEFWAHALAYILTDDYRFFVPAMEQYRTSPGRSFATIDPIDYAALLKRIRREGPLSIRDIDEELLAEKSHPWGSRKPSKQALRFGFFTGDLAISKRVGNVKNYDLSDRHFGWTRRPKPASDAQVANYLLERALRSQGIVSLDSICYGNLSAKPVVSGLIEAAVSRKRLVAVHIEGSEKIQHWIAPETLDRSDLPSPRIHILSPFDPLVIQRKRLNLFFGYEHRFEAYMPAEKRVLGYFALPILLGDEIVAAIDLKTDRQRRKLLVQKWTWVAKKRAFTKAAIEEALTRFEAFQLP